MRIFDGLRGYALRRTERMDERARKRKTEHEEHDAAHDRERHAVLRRRVGFLLPFFTETACDERVYAHAGADQHLDRIDERNGRKRVLRILRNEDAVNDVVQRVDDHGNHRRKRH